MKVLIINYNRLTLPMAMADWCAARGLEVVFVDNASTYEPLLEYYSKCPYKVMRMGKNYGHTVAWLPEADLLNRLGINGQYIVTDPDLNLEGVPDDFLQVMQEGLLRYPQYYKCGLSLEINDLPDTEEGILVRTQFEAKYWHRPLDDRYYHAPTDTTFALYRAGVRRYNHVAIRTARPYTARHVPWYYDRLADLPADEQYYFATAGASSTAKNRLR